MKEKIGAIARTTRNIAIKSAPAVATASFLGAQMANVIVYADGKGGADATGLAQLILELVGKLIVALGIFIAALGLVNFASAHSEGNGGAQDKATKQIAAGVMVVAVAALLIANAPTLAGFITTS